MKCPKCGYLGFESASRCRNCDYDFSFLEADTLTDLPLRRPTEAVVLDDLRMGPPTPMPPPVAVPAGRSTPPRPSSDLPLFDAAIVADDTPLITRASPPRQPLAVRRSTPETPRARPAPRPLALDGVPDGLRGADAHLRDSESDDREGAGEDAGLAQRAFALVVDLSVLLLIDVVVVYLTMEICGITIADLSIVPKGPLLAFLLLQNLGYLVVFTVGGQTLGKMATGIRVVAVDDDAAVDVGRALKRTLAWLVLLVPAGLGFISAVFGRHHRGLHDRFAGTRVVRASA